MAGKWRVDASEKPKWSDEETQNAYKYGVCMTCGYPRVPKLETKDGVTAYSIACRNGHPQD